MKYYIGLQGKLLAQGIDLGEHKVIYDADDNLLLVDKADNTFEICCKELLKPNKERDVELIKKIQWYTTAHENEIVKGINHIKSCSTGLSKLVGLDIGTNLKSTISDKIGFICAKSLGNAILGIDEDGNVILSRKSQIRICHITELSHENVLMLSVILNSSLRVILSETNIQAMIAITIEDLCAQACRINPEFSIRKFKDVARYFNAKDLDSDYIHTLEREFKYDGNASLAFTRLEDKILTVIYSLDELTERKQVGSNKESIAARQAWMEENFGENWREVMQTDSPSFTQMDKAKEYVNIILSTVVFEATKMIHEAKRPICKENNIKSMYREIFNPMVREILAINKLDTLKEDIREGLKKYFEEPTVDKYLPGMNIFHKEKAPDGGLYR